MATAFSKGLENFNFVPRRSVIHTFLDVWQHTFLDVMAKRELAAIERRRERKRAAIDVAIEMTSTAVVRLIFEGQARPADVLAWDLELAVSELIHRGPSLYYVCYIQGILKGRAPVEQFQREFFKPLLGFQRKIGGLAVARDMGCL